MKVAVLYQSLRGGTERAAEKIADEFRARDALVGCYPVTNFDAQFLLKADLLVIGTWTDGLFGLAARPAQIGKLMSLPSIAHKKTAVFTTYEISAKASLPKLVDWAERQSAQVIGAAAFNRRKLDEGVAAFVDEAVAAMEPSAA
jgi:flavodoxin